MFGSHGCDRCAGAKLIQVRAYFIYNFISRVQVEIVYANLLFHSHGLRQIARLVYVATSAHGDVIGEQL